MAFKNYHNNIIILDNYAVRASKILVNKTKRKDINFSNY